MPPVTETAGMDRAAQRRKATIRKITRCAQVLADERGLDGFTMDELADAVGVSRRTLFNHVPGKLDAVLGPDLPTEPKVLTAFRQGGPTGRLVEDLRDVGASVLRQKRTSADDVARVRRLLRGDPRLVKAVHERLERVVVHLAEAIVEREGEDFDPLRARVLARLTLCIFELTIDEFLARPEVSTADHFLRVFDTAVDLFG